MSTVWGRRFPLHLGRSQVRRHLGSVGPEDFPVAGHPRDCGTGGVFRELFKGAVNLSAQRDVMPDHLEAGGGMRVGPIHEVNVQMRQRGRVMWCWS